MRRVIPLAAALTLLAAVLPKATAAQPLEIVATLPDLGSLAREVGGDAVSVTVLAKGVQDPHFVEARPSFIRKLHDADLFIVTGMDLEIGWAPVLVQGARNPKVLPGARGHLDASVVIQPLEVPQGPVDRSLGDLHPAGNPHYLTDPLNAAPVAALIRDRLSELSPDRAAAFQSRYHDFVRRLLERLVGPELADADQPERLVRALQEGRLEVWLAEHAGQGRLGGWLGAARAVGGVEAVEDHQLWAYFAQRFGLRLVARLEPFPGIAPTTRHLGQVVEMVRERRVPLLLSSVYFDPRHARWVAERTGARVVRLAHQPGARPGTDDYLATVDYNVKRLIDALETRPATP